MTATETEQKAAAPAFLQKAQDLSHFHWNERWLPLDTLVTFRLGEAVGGFQRPLQERRVQGLVDQFDAGEARTIFVSKRDLPSGKSEYVVLDGQHTAAALKRVGMTHWYCRIFFGMTPEDEASRFIEYENNSRRIPGVVQHNAEVIANTTTAVAIENILKPFYLRISTAKLRSEEGFIPIASRAGFEKLLAISPAILREVIQLVVDAWGHNRESFDSRIMSGLGYLLATSKNPAETAPFDRQRLLAVLKNTTPKLIEEAIGPTGSGGAQRAGTFLLGEDRARHGLRGQVRVDAQGESPRGLGRLPWPDVKTGKPVQAGLVGPDGECAYAARPHHRRRRRTRRGERAADLGDAGRQPERPAIAGGRVLRLVYDDLNAGGNRDALRPGAPGVLRIDDMAHRHRGCAGRRAPAGRESEAGGEGGDGDREAQQQRGARRTSRTGHRPPSSLRRGPVGPWSSLLLLLR